MQALKKSIVLLLFLYLAHSASAQSNSNFWNGTYGSVNLSAGNQEQTIALSYHKNWGIGKAKRFKIGTGVRFNAYFGQNREYTTAPAKLTSKQEGPQVLFSETFEENLDTLVVKSSNTNSVNLLINLEYALTPKLDIGFNIDAVGFSFGPTESGVLTSSLQSPSNRAVSTKPTAINGLLISDNDWGSLNSELYLRYKFHSRWAINGGLTFIFSELRTDGKYVLDNDRFRHKALMPMLGITWYPFASQ